MDTSSISFTALYTGHVWYRNGLSARFFTSPRADLMYQIAQPVETASNLLLGTSLSDTLLQRHYIIDHRLRQLIEQEGVTQVLEIACGLSPRGYKFSRHYPQVHYVEADLPDMAARKQSLLLQHQGFGPHHRVVTCNVFESGPPSGLDHVLHEVLDTRRPTVILTEGLVNYFDLPTIAAFWKRVASLGRCFPAAWYLTDLIPQRPFGPRRLLMNSAQRMLGVLTKSRTNLHFSDDSRTIEKGFLDCGFRQVQVHRPEQYYDQLPLPRSRSSAYICVVEAKI